MKAISKFTLVTFIYTCCVLSGCNILKIAKYSNQEEYIFKHEFSKFNFYEDQILINTKISDKLIVDMLFDLGAGASAIFPDSEFYAVISKYSPITSPGKSVSADGLKMRNHFYRLGDIDTKWFSIKNSLISANNRPNIYSCDKVKGLWGAGSFAPSFKGKGNKIVIMNIQDTTLAILDSIPSLKDWQILETKYDKISSVFYIRASLGSESFYFLFDTGFNGNVVMTRSDYEIAKTNSGTFSNEQMAFGYISNSLSGTQIDTLKIAYSSLSIDGLIRLDSIPIYSTKSVAFNVIGMELIKRFNVLVDYQNHKLYFQINPNFKKTEPTFYKAKGFSPRNTINSGFCIQNILSDSPAEKAGLKVGDKIISINNISAETGDICEIEKIFRKLDGKSTNNKIIVRRGNDILSFIL